MTGARPKVVRTGQRPGASSVAVIDSHGDWHDGLGDTMRLENREVRVGLVVWVLTAGLLGGCGADDLQEREEYGASAVAAQVADAGARGQSAQPEGCKTFDSSFAAIEALVFERRGCTASACHGQAKVGELDLRAGVAYENLVDVPSLNSEHARVQPGTATDSFLYQKLQAATHPGSVQIAGSPMPVGTPPLSASELEAVQLWIQKGAPKTGAVGDMVKGTDVGKLLDACLPPVTPVKTKPLDPPAPEQGIQFVLPSYVLKANSEIEQCTPFAYDFTDKVPARYKDEKRNVLYVNSSRVRQDAQSHHLVLWDPRRDLPSITPDGTTWTCRGGSNEGAACDPRKGSGDCGDRSVCSGKANPGTLCGFGGSELGGLDISALADPAKRAELLRNPAAIKAIQEALAGGGLGAMPAQIANTQSPQEYIPPMDGVYWEIPLRGVLWFNSHAFNLENQDTTLEARVNFYYADKRERELRPVNVAQNVYIAAGQPPFTRKTYCAKHVVPQSYSLALLSGHTHRRGERFWVNDASGKQIYENFVYNDPLYKRYEPWIAFDSADPAARTLEYCATYSNGLKKDGSPDLELVTRASRMRDRTSCTRVVCTAGKVTAVFKVDSECETAHGASDGDCDACPITAGQTTEDEMCVLMPWYVLRPQA